MGGDVSIARGAAGWLDSNRARRDAAEQKFVMQISAEAEQRLVDLCHPFPGRGPGRDQRYVVIRMRQVLLDRVRRRGDAVERLARIEAVVQIEAGRRDVVCRGDQRGPPRGSISET